LKIIPLLVDSTAAVVAFGEDFKGATHHGIHRKVVVFTII
jgi:hypothetical protein